MAITIKRDGSLASQVGIPVMSLPSDDGRERKIVVGVGCDTTAIITNLDNGTAVASVLKGRKIKKIRNHISDSPVSSNLLLFIMEQFEFDSQKMVEWLRVTTPDEFNSYRLMYSLSDKKSNDPTTR